MNTVDSRSGRRGEKKGEERLVFQEFYLPGTPQELEGARLYGEFCRIEDSLEGNWKVTFRMEEKAGNAVDAPND